MCFSSSSNFGFILRFLWMGKVKISPQSHKDGKKHEGIPSRIFAPLSLCGEKILMICENPQYPPSNS
jgi:hypothetical protein